MFAITLKFLEAVQKNNTTQWLHANYDLYQQEKKRFGKLVQTLIDYGKELNPERSDLQVKNCVFRFNRDIRYGADKRPYKDHFGCEIAIHGKRSGYPCFYFELRPGASFVGLGTFRVGEPFESQMRRHALLHFDQWKKIQTSKVFQHYYGAMMRADPEHLNHTLQEYKSMYCLKKAFPDGDPMIDQLSCERKKLRTSKLSYQRAWEILHLLPKREQEFYRQLCFQKDWLWQVQIPDEILLSDMVVDELKKAIEIGMPMINFLQGGLS